MTTYQAFVWVLGTELQFSCLCAGALLTEPSPWSPILSVRCISEQNKDLCCHGAHGLVGENKPGVSELESATGKAGHSMRVGERVQVNHVISAGLSEIRHGRRWQ